MQPLRAVSLRHPSKTFLCYQLVWADLRKIQLRTQCVTSDDRSETELWIVLLKKSLLQAGRKASQLIGWLDWTVKLEN